MHLSPQIHIDLRTCVETSSIVNFIPFQRQQQNSGSNDRSLDLDQDEDVAVPRRDNENIDLADLCGCSGGKRSLVVV